MRGAAPPLAFQTPGTRPNATIAPPAGAAPRPAEIEQQKRVNATLDSHAPDTAAYDSQFGAGAAAAAQEPAEKFKPAPRTDRRVTKAPHNPTAPAALPPAKPAAFDDDDNDTGHQPAPPVGTGKLTDDKPDKKPDEKAAADEPFDFEKALPWLIIPAVGLIGWLLWKKFA